MGAGAAAYLLELIGNVPRVTRTLVALGVTGLLLLNDWPGPRFRPENLPAALAAAFLGLLLYTILDRVGQAVTVLPTNRTGLQSRIPRV